MNKTRSVVCLHSQPGTKGLAGPGQAAGRMSFPQPWWGGAFAEETVAANRRGGGAWMHWVVRGNGGERGPRAGCARAGASTRAGIQPT